MPLQFFRDFKPLTIEGLTILYSGDTFLVLSIGQTEIIYYILPDPSAIFERKLVHKKDVYQMYNISTIPAYSIWYPVGQI